MIVVVASCHDGAARELVARWEPLNAQCLTCEDLSTRGWQHRLFHQSESKIVAAGRVVREGAICGVLVRRPWIFEQELVNIAPSDREYVAAEMNAFLLSWLSQLSCRVLNRPSGTCLCGPNWRPQQWAQAASRAGFQVDAVRWRVPMFRKRAPDPLKTNTQHSVEVTVVGEQCFGATDQPSMACVKRLAALAATDLLSVRLSKGDRGPHFLSANPMPALKDPELAQAVCDYLSK